MKRRGIGNDNHSFRAMRAPVVCGIIEIFPDRSFEIVISNPARIGVGDYHNFIFDIDAGVRIDLFPFDDHSMSDVDEAPARASSLGLYDEILSELEAPVVEGRHSL